MSMSVTVVFLFVCAKIAQEKESGDVVSVALLYSTFN